MIISRKAEAFALVDGYNPYESKCFGLTPVVVAAYAPVGAASASVSPPVPSMEALAAPLPPVWRGSSSKDHKTLRVV